MSDERQEGQMGGGEQQGGERNFEQPQNQEAPQEDTGNKSDTTVQVTYGANSTSFDNLAGNTVGDVRETLKQVFNIPNDAQPLVNGENVADRYRLKANDSLEFIKQAGVKG
jgi:hypothetical protein